MKVMVICLECPAAAAAASLQSCPTLCDIIDGSPQGSPVPGILQARTLEYRKYHWIAFFNMVSFLLWPLSYNMGSIALTLWNPIDCSLPGSFVHGVFQTRLLEWVAISYSSHIIYTSIKASWCSPSAYIMLYVNYISIRLRKNNKMANFMLC